MEGRLRSALGGRWVRKIGGAAIVLRSLKTYRCDSLSGDPNWNLGSGYRRASADGIRRRDVF